MKIGSGRLLGGNRAPKELAAQMKDMPRSKIEWLADAIAALAVILQAALLATLYGVLPEVIPTHFDFSGAVNGSSGKSTLIFLLGLNILMYILLTLSDRFPALMNFPVKITAQNARKQFMLMRYMMSGLKILICWMFFYISYQSTAVALGNAQGLGWWVWLFFTALIGLVVAGYTLSYKWR